jgi:hypothetical protein
MAANDGGSEDYLGPVAYMKFLMRLRLAIASISATNIKKECGGDCLETLI